jgi:hypothetical protein
MIGFAGRTTRRTKPRNWDFGIPPADSARSAAVEIAAVQRGWRDFRIAQGSCGREIPRCQKIGRSSDCRDRINEKRWRP